MTLQEQYNRLQNGKGSKQIFLNEAKKQFPNMLTNPMGFNEASKILKTRGVIKENYVDLKSISTMEATPKTSYELKFADFLAEAKKEASEENIKSVAKKTDKSVDETNAHGFDSSDKKNLDNQIGQEVLNGIYFEAKQNPDKDLEEIRKIVSKNLEKDGQYYMKNAAFGVEGLGYQETEVEEVSGKYKSSGYSDKLKKLVKESLLNEGIHDRDITSNPQTDIGLRTDMSPQEEYIRSYSYIRRISPLIKKYNIDFESFIKMAETDNLISKELDDLDYVEDRIMAHLSDQDGYDNFGNKINEEAKPDFADIDGDGDKEETMKKAAKDKKKKMKKETLESRLAEIDKQGAVVALEAKIEMVDEAIEKKNNRINMVSEDENLSELVDKTKIKAMQREVKLLERQKAKMEKMYEKMCGKTYSKPEMVDENTIEDNE